MNISKVSKILRLVSFGLALILIGYLIVRIFKPREIVVDPEFSRYISAYTSGVVSVETSIRIQLAAEINQTVELNAPVDQKLFSFSPSIRGVAYWIDNRTIEFRPEGFLSQGTTYTCKFFLSKLMEVPGKFETFVFQIQTISQNFALSLESFKPYDNTNLKSYRMKGVFLSADVIDDAEIEKILSAHESGKKLRITWDYHKEGKNHGFTIDSIERKEKQDSVIIRWDGSAIKVNNRGEKVYNIPALGDFKVMDVEVLHQPEQKILVRFSDPLDHLQNLEGMILVEGAGTLSFIIEDNEVSVFPSTRQGGSMTVTVQEGIRNVMGYKFSKTQQFNVTFESLKPQIRLIGKGIILPSSEGLIFPFQAVNLKAVDVKVIKIFENNIAYFLQTNNLDGENELRRSGRLVLKKTIQLVSENIIDYGTWNTFSLDLSKLIQQEPGAIYRIELSFKKKHSIYPCPKSETEDDKETENDEDEDMEREYSYWDSYESYYYYDYGYDYNWEERDNPCSKSYYRNSSKLKAARNLIASDLGIIAKSGNNKFIKVAVTDLRTTKPLSGVTVEVYDYQRQLLGSVTTNGEGMADVAVDHKPFLLIAKSDKQRGYLRLDDGSSLSLSSFDISGQVVQKEIKGFIYGERGVWRPGDTLYLTFVLEDKTNKLPKNHPVSMELINPLGQSVKKLILTNDLNGFYKFTTFTSDDAPTGNWTVKIKAGGVVFTKVLKIETIKPNRLKINLDFGTEMIMANDISGKLNVKWMHGATARNLRAQVLVNVSTASTSFPKYSEYVFDDPTRKLRSEEQTIFDDNTDEDGNATVTGSIEASGAPGMLKANFIVRAYEEGGDFSVDRFSIPYSPYESYTGIRTPAGDKARGMLLTDTTHIVNVVTLDEKGKPLSRQNLTAKIYKINWRWWWDASGDMGDYSSDSYEGEVFTTTFHTANGKGSFGFKINYPEWGRFLIRVSDPDGHSTGKIVYIDWPGWAGKARREDPTGASMLTFSTDKNKYKVGEKVKGTFPSSGEGRALVSIENGSKVLSSYWVEAKEKETPFEFKVSSDMAPNCYLHITYVQPHIRKNSETPIRMYGVIPIMVDDEDTHLYPEIIMPDVLRSETMAEIKVKEKNGKPMTYTLAVVDEGLLDLTRFKTPDLWNEFYAREALGVKTWDLYDWVLGAYGGKIEQLFAIGGDEEMKGKEGKKAHRFKPMVRVLGPFHLKGGTDKHKIQLPQYIGSIRVMVVAGEKGAYGNAEKAVPVRKPLMLLATLPRVLGPGERVKLPVTVFAMEKNINKVKLQVTTNDMFSINESSKEIRFDKPGDQTVFFDVTVKSRVGIGKVKVVVSSGSEKSESDIEIDVRNPNPKLVETFEQVVDAGKSWDASIVFKGMPGTNKAILEVSNLPPIDFGRRLKYLLEYPHGCVEQTTSAAFPQLFLSDVVEVNDAVKTKTELNIKAAITRLTNFILPGGGFSYWPGDGSANPWGTTYAGHFFLEAEKKGFAIPSGFKSNWIKYQKKVARDWILVGETNYYYYLSDLEQAYRLYTLALAGDADMGSMNRLRNQKGLSIQAQWRLAAAYALAGQTDIAKQLTEKTITDVKPYTGFSYTYGSEERDWAMILETMSILNERAKAAPIAKKLSERLTGANWLSTQSTAYALLAMSKFASSGTTNGNISFMYSFNKGKQVNVSTKLPVSQISLDVTDSRNVPISIKNTSNGILFVRVATEGLPETGDATEFENGIRLSVNYTDMQNNSIDVTKLSQGTDFKAVVTVSNKSAFQIHDVALSQIFPSGWEITTSRLDEDEKNTNSTATYQDIRDDRVYTYFNLFTNEALPCNCKVYTVKLNSAYQGKFYLPPVACEAMYNSSIGARKTGQWVEVVGE